MPTALQLMPEGRSSNFFGTYFFGKAQGGLPRSGTLEGTADLRWGHFKQQSHQQKARK